MLIDTLAVRQTERDVNRWYVPEVVDNVTFVSRTSGMPGDSTAHFTGRIVAATSFGGFTLMSSAFGFFIQASHGPIVKLNWARLTL